MSDTVVVVGLGEIGEPLRSIIAENHNVIGVDMDPVDPPANCSVLHLCIPFEIEDFVGECVRYIHKYDPDIAIIHSTVAVGTARSVGERTSVPVINSPVRGKHTKMREELLHYTKYIGATNSEAAELAAEHFHSLGIKTRIVSSPETSELAKLSETTYFGLLIAWAQQMERYCRASNVEYDEAVSFYEEIGFFPPVQYFPGVIGGHCVMPNIEILKQVAPSELVDAIRTSNEQKIAEGGVEAPRG